MSQLRIPAPQTMQHGEKKSQAARPARATVGPLQIGPLELPQNLVRAPMAGVTNLPFRLSAVESGAGLVFTETVSAKGLVSGGPKSWRLVESSPEEQPLAYQIFGGEADFIERASALLVERGAQWIDLNLGCPVKKFLKHGAGACLLREPERVGPMVRGIRPANPRGVVSVKVRLGWDSSSITAPEVARIAEAEGADLVSVHGRTRAQLYSGHADRSGIRDVVEAVSVPVLANGDITSAEEALAMLDDTGAAGVMIGRGAMNNPSIFSQIVELAGARAVPRRNARRGLAGGSAPLRRDRGSCGSGSLKGAPSPSSCPPWCGSGSVSGLPPGSQSGP